MTVNTHLTLVTTRPTLALLSLLHVDRAPAWMDVVSEPHRVEAIPDGTRCIGVFFESRKYRSALEWAWIERRKRGGIVGLDAEDLARLDEWCVRHGIAGTGRTVPDAVAGMAVSERHFHGAEA